jgi:hypothetical protein
LGKFHLPDNSFPFPLRLCAFAPLRETALTVKKPCFSQRRKGAKLAKDMEGWERIAEAGAQVQSERITGSTSAWLRQSAAS